MVSYLSVENSSSIPSISIKIDGELKFDDIIRGSTSKAVPIESGSANIEIINNFGKSVFDVWLSFKPNEKHRIVVYDNILSVK